MSVDDLFGTHESLDCHLRVLALVLGAVRQYYRDRPRHTDVDVGEHAAYLDPILKMTIYFEEAVGWPLD